MAPGNRHLTDVALSRHSMRWTDRELTDAFTSVVANLFTNVFNHYIGAPLDLPAAPALPR